MPYRLDTITFTAHDRRANPGRAGQLPRFAWSWQLWSAAPRAQSLRIRPSVSSAMASGAGRRHISNFACTAVCEEVPSDGR